MPGTDNGRAMVSLCQPFSGDEVVRIVHVLQKLAAHKTHLGAYREPCVRVSSCSARCRASKETIHRRRLCCRFVRFDSSRLIRAISVQSRPPHGGARETMYPIGGTGSEGADRCLPGMWRNDEPCCD